MLVIENNTHSIIDSKTAVDDDIVVVIIIMYIVYIVTAFYTAWIGRSLFLFLSLISLFA